MSVLGQLKNASKTYQKGQTQVAALSDTSFAFEAGEYITIVGPSGSGKSTLLYVLGTLLRPNTGTYSFDGSEPLKWDDSDLSRFRNRNMGFVFQTYNLIEDLTALQNVEVPLVYARAPRGERTARAREALEMVGLGHRLNHKPRELSGGEEQRVAIARAFAGRPKVILADEPTGSVDSEARDTILDLFDRLNSEGCTLIVVTHNPEVAERSRRTVVMKDGRIERTETQAVG